MQFPRVYILAFLLLLSGLAGAQQLSPKGRFTVNYTRGCTPLTISLQDLTGVQITYLLQYKSTGTVVEYEGISNGTTTITIAEADTITLIQVAESFSDPQDMLQIYSYPPTPPGFKVWLCSNLGANVEIQDRQYDYYQVQFGDGTTARADASTAYKASGQFSAEGTQPITVTGYYTSVPDGCGSATKTVTAYPELPQPQLTSLVWNPEKDSVQLRYVLDPQVQYQLERSSATSGGYQAMASLSGSSTDTLFHQAGLANSYYCYRIRALDPCSPGNNVVSEEGCTAAWSVQAGEGQNLIQYSTSSSFMGEVQLYTTSGILIDTNFSPTGTFEDTEVICGQTYCYQLILISQANPTASSSSTPLCVTAQRSQALPPFSNIASYWSNQQLVVLPQLPASGQNFQYLLQSADGTVIEAARGDSLTFNTAPKEVCFRLTYEDACGNVASEAIPFCPLYLQNTSTEPDFFLASWNAYEGYAQGVHEYILQELDEADNLINGWYVGAATSYQDFPAFTPEDNGRRFRVMALPAESGLNPSYSNIVTFELRMQAYFPNAFSPNNDGVNDEFKVLGKFVEQISLQIYNRWGELIFTSDDKDRGWNGTYKGNAAPLGAYTYKALITTADEKQSMRTGTVILTR